MYLTKENKTPVLLDREAVEAQGARIVEDDLIALEDGSIRHDAMKTAFLIFSYLMGK